MKLTRKLILGSASPRRLELLTGIYGPVEVRVHQQDENFPEDLRRGEIASYLASQKASTFAGELRGDELLITADTIVWFGDHVLNKPADANEALQMLTKLEGKMHEVFTGVCLTTAGITKAFQVRSEVKFRSVGIKKLKGYIEQYKPYDKAGSYGAQECLPKGLNPLSEREKIFLNKMKRPELFERSLVYRPETFPLIEKIDGSYFNVMGLPVVEVHEAMEQMGMFI